MRTENWEVIPDDRQTQIETIGGKVVQDFGHVEEGDNFSCSVTLSAANAEIVLQYWASREKVTVRDVAGQEFQNMRVVVKKYRYVDRFESHYAVDLEFWRV